MYRRPAVSAASFGSTMVFTLVVESNNKAFLYPG
jgi:hypothetical protein